MSLLQAPKVCCISDIHIGVHQNSPRWHEIAVQWARWLRDDLKSRDIKDIIISGDLFHYRAEIAVNTIQVATDILRLWNDFNIVILVGNHDSYYKDKIDVNSLSILKGWSNITIIDKPVKYRSFDRDIFLCPWGTTIKEIDKSDIIFGHFEIETFKLNEFKTCTEGIKSKDLFTKSDFILTGHFHLREERKYKNGTIVYLGNPYQMDFGDVNNIKGYYILDVTDKSYEFVENTVSPKHIKIKLSELTELGNVTKDIDNKVANNIVRFIIDKNIAADEAEVVFRRLTAAEPFAINIDYAINFDKFGLDETTETDLSNVDITTAIKEFINLLDIENSSRVMETTIDLYNRCK